ncbi:RNA polymerase sigma factor [Silanimonas sp.]|uniref:RNA polymerase sigma factor n=1 Tax=Silanimonas sp. TaxID=1929290 RepID=UPI001BBCCB48|nr:RNA polymerase sigma factor [Silanimonas sp.]MBS3896379.1 RNA polymerase sigma factor [Silanimonas sp.]
MLQPLPTPNVRDAVCEMLPRLRRLARALTGHVHDADDLVQVAVERALARAPQWQPDRPVQAWLYGILRNAWIDEQRARKRQQPFHAPEEAGEDVGVSSIDHYVEQLSMAAAMARLPDEQRLAVSLVLVEGLSYAEAAAVMEVPVGTLTSRLARGRQALQAILAEDTGASR